MLVTFKLYHLLFYFIIVLLVLVFDVCSVSCQNIDKEIALIPSK